MGSKNRKTTPATTSTTPQCANHWAVLTRKRHHKRNTGRSGRQNALTRRSMRRDEQVTVQGPVETPQPDGMSHGAGGHAVSHSDLRPPFAQVLKNQTVICKRLLEENGTLLLPLAVQGRTVVVNIPPDEALRLHSEKRRSRSGSSVERPPTPVHAAGGGRFVADNWVPLAEFYETASERMTDFFAQTLELFAKLSVGGNMRTRDVVSQFVPKEVRAALS